MWRVIIASLLSTFIATRLSQLRRLLNFAQLTFYGVGSTIQRPFRVPFSIGNFPLLPATGIAIILALLTRFESVVYLVGGSAVLFVITVYAAQHYWGRPNHH